MAVKCRLRLNRSACRAGLKVEVIPEPVAAIRPPWGEGVPRGARYFGGGGIRVVAERRERHGRGNGSGCRAVGLTNTSTDAAAFTHPLTPLNHASRHAVL